jgi:hypothetical protein
MGMIAQEVERELIKAKAMISAKMPLIMEPAGLLAPPMGGIVTGHAMIATPQINSQMDAIEDCLDAIVKALKKLEDRK